LNDGIFRVHRLFVVTPARLHNRILYFDSTYARGTVFGALCAYGFFGFVRTASVLSASVSDFVVGMEGYRLVVYCEVGSIPKELLLG
jgi:hypothetical protein